MSMLISTISVSGIFVSPTLAGSRSGGIIASTWASIMSHGWSGYTAMTRDIVTAADTVRDAVHGMEGLEILGDSKLCIVAMVSDRFHVYKLADEMKVTLIIMSRLIYQDTLIM